MTEYRTVKNALASRRSNIKYFSKKFYDLYIECREEVKKNLGHGLDPETARKSYRPVQESDFYNKNGSAYCEFLEIMYELEKGARK